MVRRLSDPDGMGATPTHQADVHAIETDIWGPKDGHQGEILLPVPFQEPKRITRGCQEVCSTWREEQVARAVTKRSTKMAAWEALRQLVHRQRVACGAAPPVI